MGIAVIDALPYTPLVADVPNFGALPAAGGNLTFDFNAAPGAFVAIALTIGPTTPGTFVPSLDLGSVFGAASFNTLFALPNAIFSQPITATVGVADGNGYASFSIPNPNTPAAQGLVLVHHGAAIAAGALQVGNPAIVQYK